jgi:hypothetical protein
MGAIGPVAEIDREFAQIEKGPAAPTPSR